MELFFTLSLNKALMSINSIFHPTSRHNSLMFSKWQHWLNGRLFHIYSDRDKITCVCNILHIVTTVSKSSKASSVKINCHRGIRGA